MGTSSTVSVALGIVINAPPADVFRALTDSEQHSRFTGASSVIEPVAGGRFSYFGGGVIGTMRVVTPERIEQTLRAATWPDEYTATVEQRLEPRADGRRTFVRIREEGVPADHLDDVLDGWSAYWDKLADYLRERRVDVVRRFVRRYKNEHDWDSVDELVAEDCRIHIPLPGLPQGREGMRINGRMVNTAFPDVRVTSEFYVTEGDIVIERGLASATHLAPLLDTPATGRRVSWTELHAYRIEDDRICEVWTEADFMGIMAQIGAIEAPGAGT